MIAKLLLKWAVCAISLGTATYLIKGIHIENFRALIIAALVIGLLNAILRPVFIFLTLPLNILTLGLFTFVINAIMVIFASELVSGFQVTNFWAALLAAIIMSIISLILNIFIADT